jgi:tRNA wybutosine-synthesizing protein 2
MKYFHNLFISLENYYVGNMKKTPYERIAENCQNNIPLNTKELGLLPYKWELIGEVLILRLPNELKPKWSEIAKEYADILGAETVLRRFDKIQGIYREPSVELILGDERETLHLENKIKFKLNPMKVMFSSGNIDERIRISKLAKSHETVVDMFAGIGYFCIPMAVYSKPDKIIACELNPVAHRFLCENIELNNVKSVVEPMLGDNRKSISRGIADRIIMGYIKSDHTHRLAAFKILNPAGGMVHYHDVGFKNDAVELAFGKVEFSLSDSQFGSKFKAKLCNHYSIKSFGPKLNHVVLDIELTPL